MPYLIDSTHVIFYTQDLTDAVELVNRLTPSGIAVSIITRGVSGGLSRQRRLP
jgi:hypothetical protein